MTDFFKFIEENFIEDKQKQKNNDVKEINDLKNIEITDEFKHCFDLMENTNDHVFITGQAGSGKSTLSLYFLKNTRKNVVVVGPTGIAAVNIGGVTIHNFFKFPAKPLTANEIKIVKPEELSKYKEIDTILIDEISMVRSDMCEAMNLFLQINLNSDDPFGGKQVIMVGDPMQLPPVVPTDAEARYLKQEFGGEFFFDATVWKSTPYHKILLTKNFRQKDKEFLSILDRIKIGTVTTTDLNVLNSRFTDDHGEEEIPTICTTNALANHYNQSNLDKIDEKPIMIPAIISGKFNSKYTTFEERLIVKPGALIMVIVNDNQEGKYFNGTVGRFVEYNKISDTVTVEIKGEKIILPRSKMDQFEYKYSEKTKKIEHESIGKFEQFPITLGYALTVHRVQGKTFEKCIIDLGNGAFTHGQTYVALSRCKTLDGIFLKRKIQTNDIIINKRIQSFMKSLKTI